PSEEGGLEEFVEFLLRRASCRSRSVICFSCSAIFFWASANSFSFSWTCFSSSAIRSLRFLNFSWSRSNSRRKKFSEDRGRLEPRSFAATRRAVLAYIPVSDYRRRRAVKYEAMAMEGSTISILVVDDYEPWRRFVSTRLHKQPELQVMGEALHGLEAVRKAQQLHPDLILLDIGLPS